MRRRTEGERFFDWQGRRSRRPVRVADAGGRRQAKNTPPECGLILLGALITLLLLRRGLSRGSGHAGAAGCWGLAGGLCLAQHRSLLLRVDPRLRAGDLKPY